VEGLTCLRGLCFDEAGRQLYAATIDMHVVRFLFSHVSSLVVAVVCMRDASNSLDDCLPVVSRVQTQLDVKFFAQRYLEADLAMLPRGVVELVAGYCV
jgi:hypothetical protein